MKKGSKTDWRRLNEMKDEAIDTGDIPELGQEFFERAEIKYAPGRTNIHAMFEKLAQLLNIRLHNEKKPTYRSS